MSGDVTTLGLVASLLLGLLMIAWRPIPGVVWHFEHPLAVGVLWGLFTYGWLLVLWTTFMIDHFDLFGLRQVTLQLRGRPYTPIPFQVGDAYRYIRHPMMLGMIIAFWATVRGRSVDPVRVSRFSMIGRRFISTLGPRCSAICTTRPSTARAFRLRGR